MSSIYGQIQSVGVGSDNLSDIIGVSNVLAACAANMHWDSRTVTAARLNLFPDKEAITSAISHDKSAPVYGKQATRAVNISFSMLLC